MIGIVLSSVDLLRLSFSLGEAADQLARADLALRVLVVFMSILVVGYAYFVEGPLPQQITNVIFCATGIHLALLLLPAFWMIPGSIYLSLTGALASALTGTSLVVAKYVSRFRLVGVVAEGLSPRMLSNLSLKSRPLTDPNVDLDGFDVIVVSHQALTNPRWAMLIARAAATGREIQYVTQFSREKAGRIHLDHLDSMAIDNAHSRYYCMVKRAIDVVLVLVTAPIVLLIVAIASVAILLTMGHPILFVQDRVGVNGSIFSIYKLRTMRTCRESGTQIATARGDSRITPLGKFLRRYHIDELPQLWNVLKGDMTLIGPRPEQPDLVRNYAENLPGYGLRHLVRPGISGWSQVQYGYASTLEETREKLEFDLFYVEQFGPALDAKIVIKTVLTMFDPRHVR